MGIEEIAKVSRSWFLGCDLSLDCTEGVEDNEQYRDTIHWQERFNWVYNFEVLVLARTVKDFIPMGSKEESERQKRKGLNLEREQVKKQKSSEEPPELETTTKEFTEDKIKEIMQLVPVEDVYVQALQVKHPIIDWKGRIVGNKMHKAFPLPGESSHWQYKFPLPVNVVPTARRLEMPLPGVCTAIEEIMQKLPVKDKWQLH
nr:hypothetical protein [Tanacetum cinerariifolium]